MICSDTVSDKSIYGMEEVPTITLVIIAGVCILPEKTLNIKDAIFTMKGFQYVF